MRRCKFQPSLISPEGDGFEGSLGDGSCLLDLRGLQMKGHVLQPEERAVRGREEQALKRRRVVWPNRRVHKLRLQLGELLFCVLLLLLKLFTSLLHRLFLIG